MSLSRFDLEREIKCPKCSEPTRVIVIECGGTKVHDPMCRACYEQALAPPPRRRTLGRADRALARAKRRGPEILEPECLNDSKRRTR